MDINRRFTSIYTRKKEKALLKRSTQIKSLEALSKRYSSNQVTSFAWRIIVKFTERQILDRIMEFVTP
tara:strand:- start:405 stop:608 length:204 start_codon:yes stop_codon:yes gene_type:complete